VNPPPVEKDRGKARASGAGRKSPHDFRWRYAAAIFLLALAFRAAYLAEFARQPDFQVFYMDEEYNLEWAKSLATGVWKAPYDQLRDAPYFRAPLYSYFLAGIFKVFGLNTVLARLIQILLGSLSCALAYGVAAKCLGQRVGLVTGVICALYWVLAYFDAQFLQPVLLIFLLLAGLLAAFTAAERHDTGHARHTGRVGLAALAGLAFGLYAITRPEILVFLPFLAWWALKAARSMGMPGAGRRWFVAALVACLLLPPAATTLRNGIVAHDWVAVASQGGVNFYIGNNPESNGVQAVVPGTHATWWGGYEDTKAIAERDEGKSLKASEISSYWFRRGFGFIRDDPGRWFGLTLKKAALFVGNVELPNNEPYEARRGAYWSLKAVPLGFGLLAGLFAVSLPGLLGMRCRQGARDFRGLRGGSFRGAGGGPPSDPGAAAAGADREIALRRGYVVLMLQFLGVYALTTVAFFVTGRFRAPLVPLVAIGAATTLVALYDQLRARRLAALAATVAAVAAIAGILSVDWFGMRKATSGFAAYSDALDMLETGKIEAAITRLEAIRKAGSVQAPEVYVSLARAYVARSRPDDARAILEVAEEGLGRYPGEVELLWFASLGQVAAKQWDLARDRVDRYLAVKPGDARAVHLAFITAMAQGRTDDASALIARAEKIEGAGPIVDAMRAQLDAPRSAPGSAPGSAPESAPQPQSSD
jgi:4-amino-4-deoxy-L-arabinose transferase-like glycosyltransferase